MKVQRPECGMRNAVCGMGTDRSVPNSAFRIPHSAFREPSGAQRLDFVDGLRALACLSVVLHHLVSCVWDAASHQLPSGPWRHLLFLALFGRLAVALFIVISGFCLMLPVSRRELDLRGGVP